MSSELEDGLTGSLCEAPKELLASFRSVALQSAVSFVVVIGWVLTSDQTQALLRNGWSQFQAYLGLSLFATFASLILYSYYSRSEAAFARLEKLLLEEPEKETAVSESEPGTSTEAATKRGMLIPDHYRIDIRNLALGIGLIFGLAIAAMLHVRNAGADSEAEQLRRIKVEAETIARAEAEVQKEFLNDEEEPQDMLDKSLSAFEVGREAEAVAMIIEHDLAELLESSELRVARMSEAEFNALPDKGKGATQMRLANLAVLLRRAGASQIDSYVLMEEGDAKNTLADRLRRLVDFVEEGRTLVISGLGDNLRRYAMKAGADLPLHELD
ncbi:MAG: hypothetical protein AAFU85_12710 [Planctomycetota bacterium]